MSAQRTFKWIALLALLASGTSGCRALRRQPATAADIEKPAAPQAAPNPVHPRVKMVTTLGDMVFELDAEKAPATVLNFVQYAEDGVYDGTVFHRVIKDSLIQGGGYTPDMEPRSPAGPPAVAEGWQSGLENARGTIALIRSGDRAAPSSAQFFINVVDNSTVDEMAPGKGLCAAFGKVVDGLDTLEQIRNTPVGPHPKYAAGRSSVVPSEPVVIKSVRLLTRFDQDKARAKVLQDKVGKEDRLGKVIAELEDKAGRKMVTTDSGLKYVDFVVGSGRSPTPESTIEYHYRGKLLDGTEFESTYSTGPRSSEIRRLIAGVREGVGTMQEGGRRTLIVPPELAFGAYGVPDNVPGAPYKIPPNATLVFEIELLAVK